jgi:hypothetical protein
MHLLVLSFRKFGIDCESVVDVPYLLEAMREKDLRQSHEGISSLYAECVDSVEHVDHFCIPGCRS